MPKNISPFNKGIGRLFDSSSGYVLEFFLDNRKNDYAKEEIRKFSKVSEKSLEFILPRFETEGIIFCTRKIGKVKLFQLSDNKKIEGLREAHIHLTIPAEDESQ